MDPLDELPLEVLLALQEALVDPTATARIRAAGRASDRGVHVELAPSAVPRYDPEPIPMEPAEEGVESLTLRFDRSTR